MLGKSSLLTVRFGGSSEVQKNIIARRHLGLPKNF